mmetsp:Transcript_32823/g.93151  ORF Transcript_32823/g.93151 Transcript_32823/m.93151 type:complete len:299 (-) Transcript_32823:721-1617(-)
MANRTLFFPAVVSDAGNREPRNAVFGVDKTLTAGDGLLLPFPELGSPSEAEDGVPPAASLFIRRASFSAFLLVLGGVSVVSAEAFAATFFFGRDDGSFASAPVGLRVVAFIPFFFFFGVGSASASSRGPASPASSWTASLALASPPRASFTSPPPTNFPFLGFLALCSSTEGAPPWPFSSFVGAMPLALGLSGCPAFLAALLNTLLSSYSTTRFFCPAASSDPARKSSSDMPGPSSFAIAPSPSRQRSATTWKTLSLILCSSGWLGLEVRACRKGCRSATNTLGPGRESSVTVSTSST